MDNIFYEDLDIGDNFDCGNYTISKEEIIEFAEKYDPQPKHLDEEFAKETMFGGLIASGWHTCSVCVRTVVDNFLSEVAIIVGLGGDNLHWKKEVRPNDTLSTNVKILDKRPSKSNPNQGIITIKITAVNQKNDEVLTMENKILCKKKTK